MRRSQTRFAASVAAFIGVSASAFAQQGNIYKPAWTFSSGNVAAATATCTAPAPTVPPAGATATASWVITGFEITGGGATSAAEIVATLSNLQGGTATYDVNVPSGATTAVNIVYNFPGGLLGQIGQAVVLTVPSFGSGNTNAACTLHAVPLP